MIYADTYALDESGETPECKLVKSYSLLNPPVEAEENDAQPSPANTLDAVHDDM
jgi:hypothetical protein